MTYEFLSIMLYCFLDVSYLCDIRVFLSCFVDRLIINSLHAVYSLSLSQSLAHKCMYITFLYVL